MPDTTMESHAQLWTDLPVDRPMNMLERRRVIGEKAMVSHIKLDKGFTLQSHQHENEQISCVISGKLKFGIGAPGTPDYHDEIIEAGGVILLPSNTPHGVVALEDTIVLDVFAPPSQGTGIDSRG